MQLIGSRGGGGKVGVKSVFPRYNSLKCVSSINYKPSTPETPNVPEQRSLKWFFNDTNDSLASCAKQRKQRRRFWSEVFFLHLTGYL